MPEVNGQEKSEKATGKKLGETREKGQAAKSQEINSLGIFTVGILIIYFTRNYMGSNLSGLTKAIFSSLDELELSVALLQLYAFKGIAFFLLTIAPFLLALVLVSLVAGYGQVGFKITPKALMPKFSNMDPIKGMKNKFFSSKPFVELLKSVLKLSIIGGFSYFILDDIIMSSIGLVHYTMEELIQFTVDASVAFLWRVSLVYVVIAGADFSYQKYKFLKDLMMTKQEVKEEMKQSDGDPLIKGQIKNKQYEMARNRMMKAVPEADVVITNPTHYAIALKYDMGKLSAPKVVAKGVDLLAQKIKEVAKENNVPVHEDVPLARALYKACEVGDDIPEDLFKAVAQILAFIYQQKNTKKSIV